MKKSLITLLLLLAADLASAEIYQCRVAESDLVFTDRLNNAISCQAVNPFVNVFTLSLPDVTPQPPVLFPAPQTVNRWHNRIDTLRRDYRAAVLRSHATRNAYARLRAWSEVRQLQLQRRKLAQQIAASRLRPQEREVLQADLETIPNPKTDVRFGRSGTIQANSCRLHSISGQYDGKDC